MKNERIVFMGTPNISAQYLSALIKNHYNKGFILSCK